MSKKTNAVLAIIGVMIFLAFITGIVQWRINSSSYITACPIIKLGDTRIHQHIRVLHISSVEVGSEFDRRYWIHTYIEVYNGAWEKVQSWYDYVAADGIAETKAAQRKRAEKVRTGIGKAIREFYHGKED